AVDGVLQVAMQKRSDDRFASAVEFGNAFLAAVTVAPVASPVAKPVAVPTAEQTRSGVSSSPHVPEAGKKNFLQEDTDDAGTHLFWSVAPDEWSPLASEQEDAVPLTAGEYLRSTPMV